MSNQFDMKCPRCGASDEIDVAATIWVRLCRDGTDPFEAHNGDHEWSDESPNGLLRLRLCSDRGGIHGPGDSIVSQCPACGGAATHMGDLGQRRHFRCRDCGTVFSQPGG